MHDHNTRIDHDSGSHLFHPMTPVRFLTVKEKVFVQCANHLYRGFSHQQASAADPVRYKRAHHSASGAVLKIGKRVGRLRTVFPTA
jgi:hypothetical protein